VTPYYADDLVTLYLGDCREVTAWLGADVLVTDPPYGRGWKQGAEPAKNWQQHDGIAGDDDTGLRDEVLAIWGTRKALVFGDLTLAPPQGNKLTLIYRKPPNAGSRGGMGGWRRDAEGIYLLGPWHSAIGGHSSIIATGARSQSGPAGTPGRYGHPHAKPVDVMEILISACPPGVIADPFAGSGSTLVAARNLGRQAIGVELDERYAEIAARRLAQGVLAVTS
jgi:site-specific DNA-methyltransferase (adenine-specific)